MTISTTIANQIVDPKAYQDGSVDHAFATIRNTAPFVKVQPDDYTPFWVVSRHADIMEIEKRADMFRNATRSTTISPMQTEMMVKFITGGEANLIRSLVAVDGAEHKALRGVVFPHMTPVAVKQMEADIRAIAQDSGAHMLSFDGACDFAEDVAFLYPLRVIMSVLGVP
ncbi:MAG: cytochrome P450, partial [Sphingopyxis sp.]